MTPKTIIRAGCIRIITTERVSPTDLARRVCSQFGFTLFTLSDPDSNVLTGRCHPAPTYRVTPGSLRVRRA